MKVTKKRIWPASERARRSLRRLAKLLDSSAVAVHAAINQAIRAFSTTGDKPPVTATVSATPSGFLASLSDGRQLATNDVRELAQLLFDSKLNVDDVHCLDWREGAHAPTAGSAVALRAELRRLIAAELIHR